VFLISIVAAVVGIAVVALATLVFDKWGKGTSDDDPKGPTADHSGSMLSALFLLVYAIAIVVPWTNIDSARQNTYAEAQGITETYWDVGGLPATDADVVRGDLRDYTHFVIDREWPVMAGQQQLSPEGWTILDHMRTQVTGWTFPSSADQSTQNTVLNEISDIYQARRQRAVDAADGLPEAVLVFTVLTGIIMIIYPLLAGARPRGMSMLPLLTMAALLGISIFLVFNIDHPFSGGMAVKPDAFHSALQEMSEIPSA
jgi:hypothetical protein